MSQLPRHRVVHAISRKLVEEEAARLAREGWRRIGEPALACPVDLVHPPYWVQAMYFASEEIPLEPHRPAGGPPR